ncbi:MAG: Nif3-like dinuclear metal center hexameric protein [Actinomycetes bacterium]
MSISVQDFHLVAEGLWPSAKKEEWDVVGLVVGSKNQQVNKVLLTVDVTTEVVDLAIANGVDLIFAHHPLLLKGVTNLADESSKGNLVAKLIKAGIALYSAHTNADVVSTGTSAVLAQQLGLASTRPLAPLPDGVQGIGIIGKLEQKLSLGDLAAKLNSFLPQTATGVRVAGDFEKQVSTVALCAGAGDSYLTLALDAGADVYITSDLRHHPAQEILELAKARNVDFSLVDISHWAAEYLWLATAKAQLAKELTGIELEICDIRTDVFDFLMNNPINQ